MGRSPVKSFFIIHIIFIGVFNWTVFSQDKIVLLSGDVIDAEILSYDNSAFECREHIKTKVKQKDSEVVVYRYHSINTADIYSFTKQTNTFDSVLYQQNQLGNFLSVAEMDFFMQGKKDASNNYHCPFVTAASFLTTGVSGYLLSGSYTIVAIPFTLPLVTRAFPVRVKDKYVSTSPLVKNDLYLMGYKSVASDRRLIRAVIAGTTGTVIGALIGNFVRQGKDTQRN